MWFLDLVVLSFCRILFLGQNGSLLLWIYLLTLLKKYNILLHYTQQSYSACLAHCFFFSLLLKFFSFALKYLYSCIFLLWIQLLYKRTTNLLSPLIMNSPNPLSRMNFALPVIVTKNAEADTGACNFFLLSVCPLRIREYTADLLCIFHDIIYKTITYSKWEVTIFFITSSFLVQNRFWDSEEDLYFR